MSFWCMSHWVKRLGSVYARGSRVRVAEPTHPARPGDEAADGRRPMVHGNLRHVTNDMTHIFPLTSLYSSFIEAWLGGRGLLPAC